MNLIGHIEYLSTSHDCVIVPGIGAVLSHCLPAYYDEAEGRWFPPVRVMSFNPELSRTDGLLAASVARRDNISMDSAISYVRSQTTQMRRNFEADRYLSLGEIGTLQLMPDGRMTFSPADNTWLSPATMWLPTLSIGHATKDENAVGQRIAAEARRRRKGELLRRFAGTVACVAVLFTLGWIVVNNLTSSPSIQLASVIPVEDTFVNSEGVFTDYISDEPAQVILAQEPIIETEEAEVATSSMSEKKYLLIVASLNSQADAERFISQYANSNLGIINKDGHYRVYAAAGNSWDEVSAAAALPEISEHFPSSWVYVR